MNLAACLTIDGSAHALVEDRGKLAAVTYTPGKAITCDLCKIAQPTTATWRVVRDQYACNHLVTVLDHLHDTTRQP